MLDRALSAKVIKIWVFDHAFSAKFVKIWAFDHSLSVKIWVFDHALSANFLEIWVSNCKLYQERKCHLWQSELNVCIPVDSNVRLCPDHAVCSVLSWLAGLRGLQVCEFLICFSLFGSLILYRSGLSWFAGVRSSQVCGSFIFTYLIHLSYGKFAGMRNSFVFFIVRTTGALPSRPSSLGGLWRRGVAKSGPNALTFE